MSFSPPVGKRSSRDPVVAEARWWQEEYGNYKSEISLCCLFPLCVWMECVLATESLKGVDTNTESLLQCLKCFKNECICGNPNPSNFQYLL